MHCWGSRNRMKMNYIKLKDNSVKFKLNEHELVINIGVWDNTEIIISKESFEERYESFDKFVRLFTPVLRGERVPLKEFGSCQYYIELINELIDNDVLISEIEDKAASIGDKLCFITETCNFKKVDEYLEIIGLENYELLDIDNFSCLNINVKEMYVVLSINPKLLVLKELNRCFFKKNKPWFLALQDNQFIHLSKIVPRKSGCFECLELSNSLRVADYENYLLMKRDQASSAFSNTANYNILLLLLQLSVNACLSDNIALDGKILSIYLPKAEINIERLYRSSFCPLDGVQAEEVAEQNNINAEELLQHLLKE